jgi:hypothetical protein
VPKKYIASEMLLEAANRHQIHLSILVAETGLWASPEVHQRIVRDTGGVAMKPTVRRARTSQGEKRGDVIDGIRMDDNTYANVALKRALGIHRLQLEGFEVCHIWPRTCYDQRFHTAVANMVLLPRSLAALSDHDAEIQASLQFRSYELYGWYPEGAPIPTKPPFYPMNWRKPQPPPVDRTNRLREGRGTDGIDESDVMSPEELALITGRLQRWSAKPELNVHRIISIVNRYEDGVERKVLIREIYSVAPTRNAYGAIASLLTSKGHAYGRVFEDEGGIIRLHPMIRAYVRSLPWS